MEAINYINQISQYLIGIIAVGGIFTSLFFSIGIITSEDEYAVSKAKRNIKKTIIGVVIGLSVSGLITAILNVI